jgi:protoheme IX farnesyltransferase
MHNIALPRSRAPQNNALAASLGLANIVLYAAVYTPLKTVTIANTWVGAVVGAVPPLMGWAAAAGNLTPGSVALAAVLYWWQMPHFMALAWICKQDYNAGGYKMLSLLDATGRRTAACALRNSVYLMPLGIMAVCLGVATEAFAFENALISGGMAATAGVFYQSPSLRTARLLFRASLIHLPLLMGAMMAHRVPNRGLSAAELEENLRQRFASKKSDEDGSDAPPFGPHDGPLMPRTPLAPFPFLPVPMANPRQHEHHPQNTALSR